MRKLIGDRESFGFEYEIESKKTHVMGYIRMWVDGKFIGAIEDVNVLPAILYQFEGLERENTDGCRFLDMEPGEIYEMIFSGTISDGRRYCFSPGEAFDDFDVIAYVCNGNIFFVWKLVDRPFFSYPGYPDGVQSAQVSVDEFRQVVMELKKVVSE